MKIKRLLSIYDYPLAATVIILSLFGLLIVGSATGMGSGDVSPIFKSQRLWLLTGVAVMLAVSFIDYQFICKFYIPLYCISIAMLVLVLFFGDADGVQRWLELDFFPGSWKPALQPSEFAKLFMLIFLAKYIDKFEDKVNKPWMLLSIVVIGVLPVALIFKQPSMSASILQAVILAVMLFVGGVKYKYIFIAALVVLAALLFLRYDMTRENYILVDKIFEPYQLEKRLQTFFDINVDKDNVFQTEQSIKAIGSGMLTGKGLFNNTVYVPYSYNDFIYAVIGAEFGFLGCFAVLLVILFIVIKCFLIARRAADLCARLLASGVGAMIGAQAFVHVAVTTGLIPNTGIPLPFISAGGSSLWINFIAVGLVLNIGMKPARPMMFTD